MLGVILDLAGAVLSGKDMNEKIKESDRRKAEAISKSNHSTAKNVAGIAALGAAAVFGINKLADNKNKGGVRRA